MKDHFNEEVKIEAGNPENEEAEIKFWWKIYCKLPIIISVLVVLAFFVWEIIDPCIYYSVFYGQHSYGVMQLYSGFLCWVIWVGIASGILCYIEMKLMMAYKRMVVMYLKKIERQTNYIKRQIEQAEEKVSDEPNRE